MNGDFGLLYHFSIGCDSSKGAIAHKGPKAAIYHNITPPHFFRGLKDEVADVLQLGLNQLPDVAQAFKYSFADSNLTPQSGMRLVDPARQSHYHCLCPLLNGTWNLIKTLIRALNDGKTNLLFTGRIAPNKCQHQLPKLLFHLREIGVDARLILAGAFDHDDPYCKKVMDEITTTGMKDHVLITGKISEEQLSACFLSASIYLSLSEHEGFGVPLVEAMYFNVPVIAYGCTAVPETLGGAGLAFKPKGDLIEVALLVKEVVEDSHLRATILENQQTRRNFFFPKNVIKLYDRKLLPKLVRPLRRTKRTCQYGMARFCYFT